MATKMIYQRIETPQGGHYTKVYSQGKLLGKGGFAKCYELISEETKLRYAVKIIEKATLQSKTKEKLQSQIKIHKDLTHPHIVAFQHFFEDQDNVYILLEICNNHTLNELLKRRKRLTEIQVKYYARQIALAIKYIHQKRYIHRDLKLGNLFLSENLEIKIGDFGLATKITHKGQKRKTVCGTPNYIAPEIIDGNKGHSFEVDIWSLGAITYALVFGKPPFETQDVKSTYKKIKTCNYSFPPIANVSPEVKSFISKMLQLEPHKRATIDQLLQDEFLSELIPSSLPKSTLACPPSSNFLKQIEEQKSSCKAEEEDRAKYLSKKKKVTSLMRTDSFSIKKNFQRLQKSEKKYTFQTHSISQYPLTKVIKNQNPKKTLCTGSMQVWITYYEENPKFGLSYLLNSNAVGMRFNDNSCLIGNSQNTMIKYIPNTLQKQKCPNKQKCLMFKTEETPQDLHKKAKIHAHYHRSLHHAKQLGDEKMPSLQLVQTQKLKHRESPQEACTVFVKRYLRTPQAIFFWFPSRDIQVIFQDTSEILLSASSLIYVSKFGQRKYCLLQNIKHENKEITKRVNFITSIRKKINNKFGSINKNQQNKSTDIQLEIAQHARSCSRSHSLRKLTISNNLKVSNSMKSLLKHQRKYTKVQQ